MSTWQWNHLMTEHLIAKLREYNMVRSGLVKRKITREHSNSGNYFSHADFSIQIKSKCSDWPVWQKVQTLNLGIELRYGLFTM